MALERYNVSHAKRQARNAEKTRLTLRWLRELCSRRSWLRDGWGLRCSRFTASWTAWWRKGCWSGEYPVDGRQVSVWGLTPHGWRSVRRGRTADGRYSVSAVKGVGGAAAAPAGRAVPASRHGGPGLRLAVPAPYGPEGDEVPDALAELDGRTVAFEVERTVKSRRRYQEVVSGYLFNRKANGIDEIRYICRTGRRRSGCSGDPGRWMKS